MKYVGFKIIGTPGVKVHEIFDSMVPQINGNAPVFYRKLIRGSNRTIPVRLDPTSGFYFGIIISDTSMPDVVLMDDLRQETTLFELDQPQIKMNFFIFNPVNSVFLYSHYSDSLAPQEFARVLTDQFTVVTKMRYDAEVAQVTTKKEKNQIKAKYLPNGRRSLRYRPIFSSQNFDELLQQSQGVFDIEIDIDLEKIVPNLTSTSRARENVKTTTLKIQFNKENLRFTKRMVAFLTSFLEGEAHKARILEQANDRIIYGTNNKEFFHTEPYADFRPFLSVLLTNFETCQLYRRMAGIVDGNPLFGDTVIPCDDEG